MEIPEKRLMFQEKGTPKKFFIFEKIELSELKKSLLKCFLYFRKLNISTPTLKNYFLGESLRVFHHCFFRYFHFNIDIYYCLRVFSLLIVFVHFVTLYSGVFILLLILLLFFECFRFTNFLYRDCFLSGTLFLCCCTASATDLRCFFFNLRCFLSYTLSQHLAQPAVITASLGPVVQP